MHNDNDRRNSQHVLYTIYTYIYMYTYTVSCFVKICVTLRDSIGSLSLKINYWQACGRNTQKYGMYAKYVESISNFRMQMQNIIVFIVIRCLPNWTSDTKHLAMSRKKTARRDTSIYIWKTASVKKKLSTEFSNSLIF